MTGPIAGLVAFDLDGTLVDSAADIAASASALAVELGGRALSLPEVVAMVGEGAALLVQRALTAAGVDPATPGALGRYLAIYERRMLDTTCLYPGLQSMLAGLEPLLPLAVVTNKPHAPAVRLLEALDVRRHFLEVIGGDGPWPRKPDPAALLSLKPHAGGGPIVFVGDSPVDADTAARAGVPFVFARYGFGGAGLGRDCTPFVAEVPGELPGVIGEALRQARLTD